MKPIEDEFEGELKKIDEAILNIDSIVQAFCDLPSNFMELVFEDDKNKYDFDELTVKDKQGLLWTRDANLASKIPSYKGGLWGYFRKNTISDRMTWKEANDFANVLNKIRYAGYENWRLPTMPELEGILYQGERWEREYFHKIGFLNVQEGYYWTSSIHSEDSNYVGCVRATSWGSRAYHGSNARFHDCTYYRSSDRSLTSWNHVWCVADR